MTPSADHGEHTGERGGRCRVAILDDYLHQARVLADWSEVDRQATVTVFDRHLGDVDAAAQSLAPFDVLCVMRERMAMPAALLRQLPRLRLIVTSGTSNAALDLQAALAQGVLVSHTPVGNPLGLHSTVELTWGLILALMRRIPTEAAGMRTGGWQRTLGTTLHGKRLGVVGLGNIGRRVAAVGQAFGMDVVAWSQNLSDDAASAAQVRRVTKAELFACSDVVSIHLALSERTRGIVGADEIASMRADAVLVNTARGPLVDEAALLQALVARRIAGAGLDVFDAEPLPEAHPLRRLDNVVLTPHLGYTTRDVLARFYQDMVEAVLAFLEGQPIRLLGSTDTRATPV